MYPKSLIERILKWARKFYFESQKLSDQNKSSTPKELAGCEEPIIQNRKGKILIWDSNEGHAKIVKSTFLNEYPEAEKRIEIKLGWNIDQVSQFDLVVKSSAGFERQLPLAQKLNNTCFVMPVGTNDDKELKFRNNRLGEIVLTRAYEEASNVGTGYGEVLEFWDEDQKKDDKAVSSYSNSRVAAKLLKIWEHRGGCWEDARNAARKTAYRTKQTHPNNEQWNKKFGFGKIRVNSAKTW